MADRPLKRRTRMYRDPGLMVLGAIMAVVGAILKYAVTVSGNGFNINTIGVILLVAGVVLFVLGLLLAVLGGSHRSTMREETHNTAGGQERTVEHRDN
jgi:Mn2+/Fe2+ NRAMP family transporter